MECKRVFCETIIIDARYHTALIVVRYVQFPKAVCDWLGWKLVISKIHQTQPKLLPKT